MFKESRKRTKDDSSRLRIFNELKGQVLRRSFYFKESKRNESDYSGVLDKRFTRQTIKLHIHLGDQMKEK